MHIVIDEIDVKGMSGASSGIFKISGQIESNYILYQILTIAGI